MKTPKGMEVEDGYCIQAVGNLYGFPPAGQNFSIEFDKCVTDINTPWDLKLFYKWINGKPIFVIAHSDDFRWFGSEDITHKWDALIKNFNKHKYAVTDCTDKDFVGINITHDDQFNYYMDQTTRIVKDHRDCHRSQSNRNKGGKATVSCGQPSTIKERLRYRRSEARVRKVPLQKSCRTTDVWYGTQINHYNLCT